MSSLIKKITEYSNLYWAWEKAKWCYTPGDIWFNELEVAAFEANLTNELISLQKDINEGRYKLKLIKPIPFPKGKNHDGPRTRQTFWISVRDQVAWLAVVNIIGREIDCQMPFWSYGNRLYIPVFKSDDDTAWKFGYYRNTTKFTYRNWKQSWPLFRRHVNITAKILSRKNEAIDKLDIDEIEQSLLDTNNTLSDKHPFKVKYLEYEYWNIEFDGNLFWAGIDFEKFYPRVRQEVIKVNIKKYLFEKFDEAIEKLINNLLSFSIDYTNWSDSELDSIGLGDKPEIYTNIPTGLFVAGFLANTALLEVDNIVNQKLIARKNIAHFRYVDDHVVLAKTFEGLINWIDEYKLLLEKENIGTTFNYDKTEPESLAEYYIHLKMPNEDRNTEWENDAKSKREKAESDALLDPEFPTPLMTQTLAKVSRIARTNFQLLTPQEEQSLIADVEHLLVTEFPDQELRRDTRVSFAARMLSSLVPNLSVDIDTLYRLKMNLLEKGIEIEKCTELHERAKDEKSKEIISHKIDLLQTDYKDINYKIEKYEKEIDLNAKNISARALKMLLKAVKENHEKVRLWTRIFEFCMNSGISEIDNILQEIKKLKDKGETNDLSVSFIHSLVLQVISNLLFQSFNILVIGSYSDKKKKRVTKFISNILTDKIFEYFDNIMKNEAKGYQTISYDNFKFTAGSLIYLLNSYSVIDNTSKYNYLINKYGLINWQGNPLDFCKKTEYNFSVWVWWLLGKLPRRDYNDSPFLWDLIIGRLDITKVIDQTIIQLYPSHINDKLLNEINQEQISIKAFSNEGFLFDISKAIKPKWRIKKYEFLNVIENKTKKRRGYISLCDWIDWSKKRQKELFSQKEGQLIFDPRLGEWAALEIISWIAEIVKNKVENVSIFSLNDMFDYSAFIHPNNFILPSRVTKYNNLFTWEKLKVLFRSVKKKVDYRPKAELIQDLRFVPSFGFFDQVEQIQSSLNGLGALLICLLAKDYSLPSRWNPIGHQMAWINLYKTKLKDVPISSYTRNIIDGCFSNKNKETRTINSMKNELKFHVDDDTLNDPPDFNDIKEFIEYVRFCQSNLEKQQISVANHQPRQLIPISLKQLKKGNYQEIHNQEE